MFTNVVRAVVLVVIVCTLCKSYHVKPHARVIEKCRQLSQKEKQNMLIELSRGLHWSFLISPPFKKTSRKVYSLSRSSDSANVSETQLDQAIGYTCPVKFQPGIKICPWHYVQQTDRSRIPENIVHARCTCQHCSQHRLSGLKGDCEEVNVDTLVWKRKENDCDYDKQIEEVTVACVCRTK